jgi:hypothetical protein
MRTVMRRRFGRALEVAVVFGWRGALARCVVPLALVLVAGVACTRAEAQPRPTGAKEPAKPFRWPAATEGGACLLLDFEVVEQVIGASFDVAAKGQASETYSCVLQRAGAGTPDLTLAVSGTYADQAVFKATVAPKGSADVARLGLRAYSIAVPAAGGAGPGVEVGWLSGDNRLLVLRYRSAPKNPADPAALAPKMVELAHKVDAVGA